MQLLVNVPAWVTLHDNWGMNGKEAGDVAMWAIEVLYAELRRNPRALDFDETGGTATPAPAAPSTTNRNPRARSSKK